MRKFVVEYRNIHSLYLRIYENADWTWEPTIEMATKFSSNDAVLWKEVLQNRFDGLYPNDVNLLKTKEV